MTDISSINPLGISKYWRTRKSVIQWLEKVTPWPEQQARDYNTRADLNNKYNTPPYLVYTASGARSLHKAEILALKNEPWEQDAMMALAYIAFGAQLRFFWHVQFRILFASHPQPLRQMDWESMTNAMALYLLLGRTEEGIYQGYLTYAVLNRTYQLQLSYEEKHRHVHAFMLRLFSAWRGDVSHAWSSFAFSEPVYEGILERWRESDPEILKPWLLAACDRHTHQARMDSEKVFYDCSTFPRTPLEILLLFRLRELEGLENPTINHPLMEFPFDKLPMPQPACVLDELALGTLARVRKDWPEYDQIISLDKLRSETTRR